MTVQTTEDPKMFTHHAKIALTAVAAGWMMVVPAVAAPRAPHARLPDTVAPLLHEASASLQARRAADAENRLEQAETQILNVRANGEHGFGPVTREISAARGALSAGNTGAAQLAIGRVLQMIERPAV